MRLRFALGLCAAATLFSAGGAWAQAAAGAAFAEDSEYLRSYAADLVNAGAASARGWTGRGVTVAVFDTGISGWSSEFRGKLLTGYDAVTGRLMLGSYDVGWHGTFVAGLIAAARNGSGVEGIAYDAALLPIRIIDADGAVSLSDRQLAAGIRYAAGRASVFNNSWNSSTTIAEISKADIQSSLGASVAAWRAAVASGAIVVWAAGNDGGSNPGFLAALPAYWSDLLSGWVAAVSVDSAGVISSFSNRCGSAAAWCIAAPGEDVVSVYAGGGLVSASGTSFAAPVVSAAAAILQQMWPHLTNAQVLSVMFTTANKTGIYADASIYGQGLLDLEAATRPVGTAAIATGSTVASGRSKAAASLAVSSTPFGRSLLRALGSTPVMVLDDYDRDFYASAASFVTATTRSYDAFRNLQSFGRPFQRLEAGGVRLALAPAAAPGGDAGGLGRFWAQIDLGAAGGGKLSVVRGVSAGLLFDGTASDAATAGLLADPGALHSPFISLGFNLGSTARDSWGGAYAWSLADGAALTVAGYGTSVADRPGEWSAQSASLYPAVSKSATMGAAARLTLGRPGAALGLEVGAVQEDGTLLGAASDGAFRLADGAVTGFVGVSADLALGDGWSLFAGADAGWTRGRAASNSLVSDVGTLVATAFRLGATKADLWTEGDQAAFTVSQPLRVSSGAVSLSIPVGRNLDGSVTTYALTGDAGADGREIDAQVGYALPLGEGADATLSALARFQPDNVASAGPEGVAMARWRLRF